MSSFGSAPVFVSFGEVMLRLSPPGHQRIVQASGFDAAFGGGEANVAVSLAQWGVPSRFMTAVPPHEVGDACVNCLRGWGLDTTFIRREGRRLGLYYLENGAGQRGSKVIYDRVGSSISEVDPEAIDWDAALAGTKWFHFTGITPALSVNARIAVQQGARAAKRLGLIVSCDLNYRKNLWTKDEARSTMSELMESVDVLFANEEDADSVFGIKGSEVATGSIDRDRYSEVARQLADRYGFKCVGITLRESHSASRNGWSGMLYRDGQSYFGRRYEIEVVDRVGSGDSFAAGAIFGMLRGKSPQESVEFAVAASCLKHSVPGDFNIASEAEVDSLVRGGGGGRVQR